MVQWHDLLGLAIAIIVGAAVLLYRHEIIAFFRALMPGPVLVTSAPSVSTVSSNSAPAAPSKAPSDQPKRTAPIMSNKRGRRLYRRRVARIIAKKHARKAREVAGREAGSLLGSLLGSQPECQHLHITEKGLTEGQVAEIESWVRSGKQGFTQEKWARVMAKRPATIGEVVRDLEAKIEKERQAVQPVQQSAAQVVQQESDEESDEEPGSTFVPPPGAKAPEPYISPEEFIQEYEQQQQQKKAA